MSSENRDENDISWFMVPSAHEEDLLAHTNKAITFSVNPDPWPRLNVS